MTLVERIRAVTERTPQRLEPLSGGMIGTVYRVRFAQGDDLVAKVSNDEDPTLHIEAKMLCYLQEQSSLPVPLVVHSAPDLLLMTYIPNQGSISQQVEQDAAHHIAALHALHADQFGLSFDTLIGPLHQPNPLYAKWIPFFRDQRLLYMANVAHESGHLPTALLQRIDRLLPKLDDLLVEAERPSLIHGDLWTGNVVVREERIAGFVDPAIYYAHPEIELAFSTLFGTFGTDFFAAYTELRPIEAGFFEVRRDIYNLYPLLVHVRLFGASYVSRVEMILERFVDA